MKRKAAKWIQYLGEVIQCYYYIILEQLNIPTGSSQLLILPILSGRTSNCKKLPAKRKVLVALITECIRSCLFSSCQGFANKKYPKRSHYDAVIVWCYHFCRYCGLCDASGAGIVCTGKAEPSGGKLEHLRWNDEAHAQTHATLKPQTLCEPSHGQPPAEQLGAGCPNYCSPPNFCSNPQGIH